MRHHWFTFAVFSVLLWVISLAAAEHVIELNADFEEKLQQGNWFIDFYAPWCGYCKKLAPTWEVAAERLKGQVYVGKMDCTQGSNGDICGKYGVRGYPTLKTFHLGTYVSEYNGNRSLEDLIRFATEFAASHPIAVDKAETKEKEENEEKVEVVVEKKREEKKVVAAQPDETEEEEPMWNINGKVVDLNSDNFDELTKYGSWMLEFFAPWCGHCKALAPVWRQLSESLKGITNVGKVDCTSQSSLCSRFSVNSYPTIKFSHDGVIAPYKGPRDLQALISFGKKLSDSEMKTLDVKNLNHVKEVAILLLYSESQRSEALEVAKKYYMQYEVFGSSDPIVHQQILGESQSVPAFVIYKDGQYIPFIGNGFSDPSLNDFIHMNRYSLFPQLKPGNADDMLWQYVLLLFFADLTNPKTEEEYFPTITQTCAQLKMKEMNFTQPFQCAWIDGTKWENYAKRTYGATTSTFRLIKNDENVYYKPWTNDPKKINTEEIIRFIDGVLTEKIDPIHMNGPIMTYIRAFLKKVNRARVWLATNIYYAILIGLAILIVPCVYICMPSSNKATKSD